MSSKDLKDTKNYILNVVLVSVPHTFHPVYGMIPSNKTEVENLKLVEVNLVK